MRHYIDKLFRIIVRLTTVFTLALCTSCLPYYLYASWVESGKPSVEEITTPLDTKVVDDLCDTFGLESSDPLCDKNGSVYAPDFFDVLYEWFEPEEMTYDDVDRKIGTYLVRCEEPVQSTGHDSPSYRCEYDFHNDEVYTFLIWYRTTDQKAYQILARTGDFP